MASVGHSYACLALLQRTLLLSTHFHGPGASGIFRPRHPQIRTSKWPYCHRWANSGAHTAPSCRPKAVVRPTSGSSAAGPARQRCSRSAPRSMALPGQRSCITLMALRAASPAGLGGQPLTTCHTSWVRRTRSWSQVSSPSVPGASTGSGRGWPLAFVNQVA